MDDDHVTRTVHDMAMCFHSSRTKLELCYLVEAYLVCMPGLQLLSASLCSSDCWHYALLSSFFFFGLGVDCTACGVATFSLTRALYCACCMVDFIRAMFSFHFCIFFILFYFICSAALWAKLFLLRGVVVRIAFAKMQYFMFLLFLYLLFYWL